MTQSFLISLLVTGCSQPSFIGELRCRGEQTLCEGPAVRTIAVDGTVAEEVGQTRELELVWQQELNAGSDTGIGSVLTDDGTITMLVEFHEGAAHESLLVRYAADGQELSRDRLVFEDPAPDLRLATDGDAAYIAEVRHQTLNVYRIDEQGKPRQLFHDPNAGDVQGFAVGPDGDVFVSGPIIVAGVGGHNLEVTRYTPDGSVVYRQDALTQGFSGGDDGMMHASQESGLAVDADGVAYVITTDQSGGQVGLASLDKRGNFRWHVALSLSPDVHVALGPNQRPFVLGRTGGFGVLGASDGYALYQLDRTSPGDGSSRLTLSERRPSSSRELQTVTVDGQGRAYVLAKIEMPGEGTRDGVERYSSDFSQRESFALPPGVAAWWLRVTDDGDLMIWGGDSIARLALPQTGL